MLFVKFNVLYICDRIFRNKIPIEIEKLSKDRENRVQEEYI